MLYLMLLIVLATVLGYLLLMMGPLAGGLIGFGIVLGCLFRGLYLLNEINKRLSIIAPKSDKVKDMYERYLEEKTSIKDRG